ncbi:uncharacterized protein LOC122960912 [Acropora millepora]|uniref:uncharacterized protein LOC122960912 n=1 Tax=Acropora millepora TaxID=45264 RepID=UPI001CF59119|nr:uncharacterized protein LOC122960912 [Acropora millepora]
MDELKSLFLGVQFKDKDQVFNILQEEGIDDMETLKETREEDLRSAGLKMGDIIKIRRVLANKSVALNSSLSSTSTSESEFEIGKNEAKCSTPLHLTVKEQGVNVQPSFVSLEVTCSYSPQDLLSKCVPGTKCTKEQLYFRNLLRDCAKQSKIWDKAYPLPSIPDGKINKFFELIYTAVPQLKAHKNDVKQCLGQALQNRRKYQNDLKMGKRKAKNGSKDVKVGCKKSITAFLESTASSSSACSQSSISDDVQIITDGHTSAFSHGEEVIVYKSVVMKVKLAKAIYLGPHNDTDKADMYSLLQLCTKYIQEGEEEIPLPAATPDGDTTLNELQVNAVFSWKTKKLASGHIKS